MLGRWAAIGVLLAAGARESAGGQSAPGAELLETGERTVAVLLRADAADRSLQLSSDGSNWLNSGLVVPAGHSLAIPFTRFDFDPASGVYTLRRRMLLRLGPEIEPAPLAPSIPDLGGAVLAELGVIGGARGYVFNADGTGCTYSLYQDPSYADSYYDMTWSLVDTQAGTVTARLVFADGYENHLHLRFLADSSIEAFLSWDEGDRGVAGNDSFGLAAAAPPLPVDGAPTSLAATDWMISMLGGAEFPVSFADAGTATGPDVRTGAPGNWAYAYVRTGSNTGTIIVTDSAGGFLRVFLSFFPSGDMADFYAESADVQAPFGSSTVFGSIVRQ